MNSSSSEIIPPAKETKLEKAENSFFLDSLPKEVLEIVLRYFSTVPNAKKWETYIDLRNLVEAFRFAGGFGTLLKSRFHTLVVSKGKNYFRETSVFEWKELTVPYLWTNDIAVAHAFVVAGGGDSLRTLVISRNMYKRERDGENLVDDFVNHCPKVTSLSVGEDGDTVWTNKFGSQLEILEVSAGVPISIPEHPPALRELTMDTYVGNWDLLRAIGGSLERLVINMMNGYHGDEAGKIKLHCPNLKSISLHNHHPAVSRLLASYGDQLEYALLYELDEYQINDVAVACPNARFHLNIPCEDLSSPTLNLIGHRLVNLELADYLYEDEDGGYVELTNGWNQCVNLRHIDLYQNEFEKVQAVFSTPKKNLISIKLYISNSFEREYLKKAMVNLANGTKCVEKFQIDAPPCYIDDLDGFIEKNRATLRYISLGGKISAERKKIDELLKSFLLLPALEELYVNYEIPQDILTSLRRNGVYCGLEDL